MAIQFVSRKCVRWRAVATVEFGNALARIADAGFPTLSESSLTIRKQNDPATGEIRSRPVLLAGCNQISSLGIGLLCPIVIGRNGTPAHGGLHAIKVCSMKKGSFVLSQLSFWSLLGRRMTAHHVRGSTPLWLTMACITLQAGNTMRKETYIAKFTSLYRPKSFLLSVSYAAKLNELRMAGFCIIPDYAIKPALAHFKQAGQSAHIKEVCYEQGQKCYRVIQ